MDEKSPRSYILNLSDPWQVKSSLDENGSVTVTIEIAENTR
jgi:hypothetical protein